jgi:hypothetical protein
MKTIVANAVGAIALAAFAFTGTAQAQQCWWTGFGYSCAAPPVTYYQPQPYTGRTPYAAWNAYDYKDYRLDPLWLPSYPGPQPGGH